MPPRPSTVAPARRDSATPLFAQVRDRLRERIVKGALGAGDKLPSEGELEAEFGVSRITVRQALSDLHAAGLIEKVNGKGSFVTRPAPSRELGPMSGFYETMRRRGHAAHGKVSRVKSVRADAEVAAGLKLSPGTPLSAITITRFVDGEPYAFGTAYSSPALIEAMAGQDLETNDVITVLQDRLGYRFDTSHVDVEALPADGRAAKALAIAPGVPVLRLRIASIDLSGTPVIFSDFIARGDRFRYRVTIKR